MSWISKDTSLEDLALPGPTTHILCGGLEEGEIPLLPVCPSPPVEWGDLALRPPEQEYCPCPHLLQHLREQALHLT